MTLPFTRNVVIISLLTVIAAYASGGAAFASPAGRVPTIENPIVVNLGLEIRNLVAIDEVKESWQVAGLLTAMWNDPSLKYRPRGRGHLFRDLPTTAWKPDLEFTNEVKPTDFHFVDFYVEPDGTVVYTQAINATLSTNLDLRRFPFDSQSLPIVVQARGDDLDRTLLKVNARDLDLPKRAYAGLAQWIPVSLTANLGTVAGTANLATDVEFDLKVQRTPKPYILKFIVPLLLLVIISWVTFWLSHEEFKTKDQLTAAVSTLLIIVAFNITATSLIPRTEYITYIDALLFTCFAFVVISIAVIVAIHLLQIHHSEHRALIVRRLAGYFLPIAFLITQAILYLQFHISG